MYRGNIQGNYEEFELNTLFFQVVDLDESKMEDGLKWFRHLDDFALKSYCVVAGGDGTIGYVF